LEHAMIRVVIPAHNAERFLRGATDGVLSQTYRRVENICMNDGASVSMGWSLAIVKVVQHRRLVLRGECIDELRKRR